MFLHSTRSGVDLILASKEVSVKLCLAWMREVEIAACQNKMALTVFELGRISRRRRFILSRCLRSWSLHIVSVHTASARCVGPRLELATNLLFLYKYYDDIVCS